MSGLEFRNVSYTYSEGTPFEHKALDDINITIESGCITGLIGHTGCGKSTLVQLANGLLKPNFGHVLLDGVDIWSDPKNMRNIRFRIGLVFQYPEYQLFEETVYKDIAFGPVNMGLSEGEVNERVRTAAKFVGLESSVLQKSPFELSGGQKRRVAIAGIIAMEPEVLILDEPAAGLDPMGREEILGGIWSYQRARGNTVVIVSHSMEDMAQYADRVIVMNNGHIFKYGSCRDIFDDADALISVGLDIPQITKLMSALESNGLPLRKNVFTVEEARDELIEYARRKRHVEK